jgi:chemotaxis protein methyltransferase CheR
MDDALIQLFIKLITAQIGLQIRPQDRSALSQKLLTRMNLAKIPDPEKYYQLLTETSFQSKNEWRELVLLLTTIESYFMRDQGQFSLLKKTIFPKLIKQKKTYIRHWELSLNLIGDAIPNIYNNIYNIDLI